MLSAFEVKCFFQPLIYFSTVIYATDTVALKNAAYKKESEFVIQGKFIHFLIVQAILLLTIFINSNV